MCNGFIRFDVPAQPPLNTEWHWVPDAHLQHHSSDHPCAIIMESLCAAGHECDPDICQACAATCEHGQHGGRSCHNMRLRLRQHKRVAMGLSKVAGWGAFLQVPHPPSTLISVHNGTSCQATHGLAHCHSRWPHLDHQKGHQASRGEPVLVGQSFPCLRLYVSQCRTLAKYTAIELAPEPSSTPQAHSRRHSPQPK